MNIFIFHLNTGDRGISTLNSVVIIEPEETLIGFFLFGLNF